jgi:hypothetical protein
LHTKIFAITLLFLRKQWFLFSGLSWTLWTVFQEKCPYVRRIHDHSSPPLLFYLKGQEILLYNLTLQIALSFWATDKFHSLGIIKPMDFLCSSLLVFALVAIERSYGFSVYQHQLSIWCWQFLVYLLLYS